ncbi:hypothetical protein ACK3SF_03100 [Candidatus Nanosalina sp. VS9-1]|uniref:hypothetical protein n=1 Tax=Candidatus Nanosalina sp. VS9-1 TaxID=3388566 RepID=UPI0039E193AF
MKLYSKLEGLELRIESFETETREKKVSENFTRKTTVVKFSGNRKTGKGEDVIYEPEKHFYPGLELEGTYTFHEFSQKLEEEKLFPEDVEYDKTDENYRRWAIESAALDLALKQNNQTLAEALGESYRPLRFVVSLSMDTPSIEKLQDLIELNSSIEFKLDASEAWDETFVEKLVEMDRVKVVDLKGHYKKENVGMNPDPEIYRLIAEKMDALIEDPKLTDETEKVLENFKERITWDYPITGLKSVKKLPFRPDYLNIKPSRFGTVKSLLDTIEYCQENNIQMYGGGQFELDIGRQHIHAVASIFYPKGPNDVAPRTYNQEKIPENPPKSPLRPEKDLEGLEWRYRDNSF